MFDNNLKISILELMKEEKMADIRRKFWKPADEQEDIQEFVEVQGGGEVDNY